MSVLGYTVFSDDFNRADSGTVGNGWSEAETAAIVSNQCRIGSAATNSNAAIYRDLTSIAVLPYEMSGTFNINGGTRLHYISPFYSTVAMNGLFMRVVLGASNNVTIYDGAFGGGGTTLTTVSFTLTASTKYWFWINITRNGTNYDMNCYLSTTSTKPGSPTITATAFVPSQLAGTYSYFLVDANNNNFCDIDFITYLNSQPVIVDSANTTTDAQSYSMSMTKADTNTTTDTKTVKYGFSTTSKSSTTWTNTPKS